MNMLRITIVLAATIASISCGGRPRTGAIPPGNGAVVQSDSPESGLHHPADHPLREVPILIGLPRKEMVEAKREGKALLGGCVVSPDQSPTAKVCERCRVWKTDDMKYWQPLPREFGELAAKSGG